METFPELSIKYNHDPKKKYVSNYVYAIEN
jgi:hypothetical protein